MAKIALDKYYTPEDLARRLIGVAYDVIGRELISEVVEPSAGSGAFSSQIEGCVAYDIAPEGDGIIQADFLSLPLAYKMGRLFIGNPPFGVHNALISKFYDKCCAYGDYIAFVLPISCLNNDIKLYKFDLVHSEDLGPALYSGRALHCCFNVYRRPAFGGYNSRPDYTLNEVTIIEHRRKVGGYATGRNKDILDGYCYAMCNWGSIGKVPKYVGEFAQEVYFYCSDAVLVGKIRELLSEANIRRFACSISASKISVMRLYKYLYDNIEGLSLRNPRFPGGYLF